MNDIKLHTVTLRMCELCLAGSGGECHSAGCAFWLNRAPDIPLSYVLSCEPDHPNAMTSEKIVEALAIEEVFEGVLDG